MNTQQITEQADKLAAAYRAGFERHYTRASLGIKFKARNGAAFFKVSIDGDDGGKELTTEDMAFAIEGFNR